MKDGVPTVCVPVPGNEHVREAVLRSQRQAIAAVRTTSTSSEVDVNGGRMDGFLTAIHKGAGRCKEFDDPNCAGRARVRDVLGYHDGRELANYWKYARDFVLQDHLFENVASWSLPQHLFMVSEWSAKCAQLHVAMSCATSPSPRTIRPISAVSRRDARSGASRLRLDRSDVSAPPQTRELGVLRDDRDGARLRQRL